MVTHTTSSSIRTPSGWQPRRPRRSCALPAAARSPDSCPLQGSGAAARALVHRGQQRRHLHRSVRLSLDGPLPARYRHHGVRVQDAGERHSRRAGRRARSQTRSRAQRRRLLPELFAADRDGARAFQTQLRHDVRTHRGHPRRRTSAIRWPWRYEDPRFPKPTTSPYAHVIEGIGGWLVFPTLP